MERREKTFPVHCPGIRLTDGNLGLKKGLFRKPAENKSSKEKVGWALVIEHVCSFKNMVVTEG